MRKFFLLSLLFAATSLFAEVKVETFDTKDGTTTNTYVTTETTKECQQASWTFLSGGILKNLGNMGNDNFAAVIRAKKSTEEVYPYIESSTIDGGIDSLWFTWNSNGNETGGTWNVKIYVNDTQVGAITGEGGPKASAPFNKYGVGNLNITGEFTIKFVNESPYDGTGNSMRFVFDDLSWTTKAAPGEKQKPDFAFEESALLKMIDAEGFVNTLTNTSDATPVFESSNPEVATVDQDGLVTIVGLGNAVISASIEETETFKAAEASYSLRVVPLNFNMETFDGAANITSGSSVYLTAVTPCPPSEATGIVWTTWLGSVRDGLGSWPAANIAAAIRAIKGEETEFGYLISDSIEGGIDALAFDWNSNGDESGRQNPWDIRIYINDEMVGSITDECKAKQSTGNEFRFLVENLKIDGKFVIKIENHNTADANSNHYRFVLDNLEWYSYEKPCEGEFGILVDAENYIPGQKNEAQTGWLEYMIVADLEENHTFSFYDNCSKIAFMANQEDNESNYKFNVDSEYNVFVVPATGKYTIYLKMYGIDDNWIWTVYEEPTGIEQTAIKADVRKTIEEGIVVIYRNGIRYNLQGQAL